MTERRDARVPGGPRSRRGPAPHLDPGRVRRLLFRATLLGYPRRFRRTYAVDLEQTFSEAWAAEAQTTAGALRFWPHVLYDGVVNGTKLRRRSMHDPLHMTGDRRRISMLASMFQGLLQDARLALRGLRRQSASASAVVLTLALGIGAATAIFSVVDAVLLRPLPFTDPDGLVELSRNYESGGIGHGFAGDHARGIMEGSDVFAMIGASTRIDGVLTGHGDPRALRVRAASSELFSTLGRTPAIGRGFTEREVADGARVMLLSYELWNVLGADRSIIGNTLEFDGDRYEVIGIMPSDFRFPTVFAAQAFVPLTPAFYGGGLEQSSIELVARLRAGVTPDVASERTAALVQRLLGEQAAPVKWTATATQLGSWRINPNPKKALLLVSVAVALMLLIALMNATNLLLTRVSVRAREFGVRHSLGASRGRLLRQLVTESLSLAVIAGAAATLMAIIGVHALMRVAPTALTDLAAHRVVIDGRVLLFTFVTTVRGRVPARRAAGTRRGSSRAAAHQRVDVGVLRRDARAAPGTRRSRGRAGCARHDTAHWRGTAERQLHADHDCRRWHGHGSNVARADSAERARLSRRRRAFAAQLEERIAALPGVEAVTRASSVPPSGSFSFGIRIQTEDDDEPRVSQPTYLPIASIRPDFIPTVGARLIAGRNFTPADTRESNVVIIDRDFAEYLWGAQPAVGRRFRTGSESPWLEVVGVVEELMLGGPDNATGEYALLYPASPNLSAAFYAVRAHGGAGSMIKPIRDAIREQDPNQPVWTLSTARAAVADEVTEQRFFMILMIALGAVSLGLSALGLYSLLSFAVGRRTRELGIRMALGARTTNLLRMVIGQGMALAAIGVVIGLSARARLRV